MASLFARRQYTRIAEAMYEAKPIASPESERGSQWFKTVAALTRMLEQDNPSFDKGKFVRRCNTEA